MAYLGKPVTATVINDLNDIVNVNSPTPVDNQGLIYDSSTGKWINETISTSIVTEGTNLYYTKARVDSDFDQRITAVPGSIIPSVDSAYDLGSVSLKWRDLYLSGSSIFLGSATITSTGSAVNLPGGTTINGVTVAALDSGGIRGLFSASGDLTYNASTGEFSFDVENVYTQANFDSDFNTSLDAAALGGSGLAYNATTNTLSIDSAELSAFALPIRSLFSATGDLSYNSTTGAFSIDVETVYTRANFDSDFNEAIDEASLGGRGLIYDAGTNTLSIDSNELAEFALPIRALFSAGGDLSYNSSTGQFSFNVETVYTKANFDSDLGLAFSTSAVTTTNLAEGTNLYYTTARADSDFDVRLTTKTTTNLAEGTNLYYTTARADSDFDVRLTTKSTTNLAEGTNLYYTTARADSDFDVRLTTKTTSDLIEGTNLYYTIARADSDAKRAISAGTGISYTPSTGVISTNDSQIVHDNLSGFVSNEHIDHSTVNIIAGRGLSGGGDITSSVTVDIDSAEFAAAFKTTNLPEGTNLYYTTARADSDAKRAISVTDTGGDGSITYSSTTGVITYTGPSATEVRAHFSAGNGIKISSGQVSIDSASDVVFASVTTTGNVVIGGNLQVDGTQTIVSTQNLSISDNMFYLNQLESAGSPTIVVDLGWAANYNDDGTYAHAGMFRDATDNTFKVFQGYTPEPDSALEIDVNHGSFSLAPFAALTLSGIYLGFDSDFGDKSTTDLVEGTNLYYTTARADSDAKRAVSAGTGISYTASTGVIATNDSQIVHDNLSGFVSNEHIDHSTVTLTAGNGLTGGGDITTSRTFAVGAGVGIKVDSDTVSIDSAEIVNYALPIRALFVGGDGLTLTDGTFAVNAGVGIKIETDAVSIDSAEIVNYATPIRNLFAAGNAITYTAATGTIAVSSNSIQADELDVSGNGSAGQALLSDGDGSFSWGAAGATITDDSSTDASRYLLWDDATSGTSTTVGVSSTKLYFNPFTGQLNATNFNSLSDVNLKENIVTITNALDTVSKMRGVTFNWKDTGKRSVGLIAQEVETIVPEVVNQNENNVKSVNYDAIIGLLVEAIKDLKNEIATLKKV